MLESLLDSRHKMKLTLSIIDFNNQLLIAKYYFKNNRRIPIKKKIKKE